MKIVAINGSPRKNWNTHMLLDKALEGAKSVGAETELIHLYDLNYKGCIGCLACKRKNGKSLGRCAVNDDLKNVLDIIDTSDGFILGSPIYLSDVTGMMRSFLERLIFQYLSYDDYTKPYFKGNTKAAVIYTMNISQANLKNYEYDKLFDKYESMLNLYFKNTHTLLSTETLQVNDYSKYEMKQFNEAERIKRREEVFPINLTKAFELGESLAT